MILTDRSIKSQIKYQVPWFFNQEYSLFVKFLEYYYQWLETFDDNFRYGVLAIIDNFKQFKDIDHTIEQLIPYFKNPYFNNIPSDTFVERRVFIKRVIDLYRSKGSFKSLKLLIKIILGEDIDIWYPKSELAKSSDLLVNNYFFAYLKQTDFTIKNLFELRFNTIHIANIPIQVSSIIKFLDNFKLVLDFDTTQYDTIKNTKDVYFQGTKIGELLPLIDTVSFNSGQKIWKNNDIFQVTSETQSSPTICKVKRVKPGKIDSYLIKNRGRGYVIGDTFCGYTGSSEFLASISNTTPIGEVTRITFQKNSAVVSDVPKIVCNSETGTGLEVEWYSSAFSNIHQIEVLDPGVNMVPPFEVSVNNCTFTIETSYIIKHTTVDYTNNLGYFNILPDSKLWQNHSYVLNFSSSLITLPKDEITALFKPLGEKLFYNKVLYSEDIISDSNLEVSDIDVSQIDSLKLVPIFIGNIKPRFPQTTRKYTNDTPLSFVKDYSFSNLDMSFCFEVKPEITVLPLAIIDTVDNLETVVSTLEQALQYV